MKPRYELLAVLLLAVVATLTWAALRICPACGREALADEERCRHCNALLPPVEAVVTQAAPIAVTNPLPADVDSKKERIPTSALQEQLGALHRAREAEAWWGVVLYGQNVMAWLALEGGATATQRVAVAQQIRHARRQLVNGTQPCPVCKGTGSSKMKALTLKGEVIEQTVVGGTCPYCKGVGRVSSRVPDDELSIQEARALQAYAAEQERRGLENVRGLWLPPGVWETLSPKEQAAMRRAAGVPCAACMGFGTRSCKTCHGTGILPCPNKDCTGGMELCPDCRGTGKSSGRRSGSSSYGYSSSTQLRCETCNGSGKRTCTTCQGKGFVPCDDCKNEGETVCTTCRGTGEAPVCTKCQGDGIIVCTRCNGTGQYRGAPCSSCNGRGATLCKSCNGSGRIPRR